MLVATNQLSSRAGARWVAPKGKQARHPVFNIHSSVRLERHRRSYSCLSNDHQCLCVRPEAWLAAIARTYANTDMARYCTGCAVWPAGNTETTPEPGEVDNVSRPTMTVCSPKKGKNTGAAVVVFPGGGYYVLAIDLEGMEVCDWLTSKGITCVAFRMQFCCSALCAYVRHPTSTSARAVATATVQLTRTSLRRSIARVATNQRQRRGRSFRRISVRQMGGESERTSGLRRGTQKADIRPVSSTLQLRARGTKLGVARLALDARQPRCHYFGGDHLDGCRAPIWGGAASALDTGRRRNGNPGQEARIPRIIAWQSDQARRRSPLWCFGRRTPERRG
jgi:hypothetical protein